MSASLRIRPLDGASELEAVMAIDRESFSSPWTQAMYEGELADRDAAFVIVAELAGGAIVGYCSFRLVFDEFHINNVAVAGAVRRQGTGRLLVTWVLDEARRRRLARVLLEVRAGNAPARNLYERLGFVGIGCRRAYYDHPTDDALVLAYDLRNFESDPTA